MVLDNDVALEVKLTRSGSHIHGDPAKVFGYALSKCQSPRERIFGHSGISIRTGFGTHDSVLHGVPNVCPPDAQDGPQSTRSHRTNVLAPNDLYGVLLQ